MSYRPQIRRPGWMFPLLLFWVVIALPGYVLGLLYRGTPNPLPDPPPMDLAGFLAWILAMSLIFGSPIALLVVERRYRRAVRNASHA